MKKIAAILTWIAMIATACNLLPEEGEPDMRKGGLVLRIGRMDCDLPECKSVEAPDTNMFVLIVADLQGKVYYEGLYGARPESIQLSQGTYQVSLVSGDFSQPAFDAPQWGADMQVDIVADEITKVNLECSQINAGVRILFGSHYKEAFGESPVRIVQEDKSLVYAYGEERYAYFTPGEVRFDMVTGTGDNPIFKRVLRRGVNLTINLDASSDKGGAIFSVEVDMTAVFETEDVLTDGTFFEADGLSPRTAFSIDEAVNHPGDTVWVWGYIVGGDCTADKVNFFTEPVESTTHIAIAASKVASARSECMAVELSKAALRSGLNLVDNPELKYRKVYLRGKIANYMGSWPGVKNLIEYQF